MIKAISSTTQLKTLLSGLVVMLFWPPLTWARAVGFEARILAEGEEVVGVGGCGMHCVRLQI